MKTYLKILFAAGLILTIATACGDNDKRAYVTDNFESGSIGDLRLSGNNQLELSLADDNDNPELPDRWRTWWYVRIDIPDPESPVAIHLKNRGWPYYYTPVYSYDQRTWHRFSEDEVLQPDEYQLEIKKKFTAPAVWVARFYPYSYSDLIAYIQTIKENPNVTIETPAVTQENNPIYFLTLTDDSVDDSSKKRIWIHARTHPAETCPSFLLEGLIDFLLRETPESEDILSRFIFNIVPMQNIDGVIAGNYRTTPESENLEVMWYSDPDDPLQLTKESPLEVKALHQIISDLMTKGPAFSMALNLHSSNSEPDIRPFFFPHFGSEADGYTTAEAALWNKQIRFIKSMKRHYGEEMIEPLPSEGGSSFAAKNYPESWWWRNFKEDVMAITFEMTYGRAGYSPDWVTPDDLRSLGEALALGVRDYSDPDITFAKKAVTTEKGIHEYKNKLKYPGLYPPDAPDEMKE